MRKNFLFDTAKNVWLVLSESASSFLRNNDLKSASSLAFYSNLALIPSLFLLTYLLGSAIGSSQKALMRTQELVVQFIPRFSEVIMKEVGNIARHRKALGIVNLLILLWSITPLVGAMRSAFGQIFKKRPEKSFFFEKFLDILIIVLLLTGVSVVAVLGVVLRYLKTHSVIDAVPHSLEHVAPFVFILLLILFLYYVFTPKIRASHLLAGSFVTSTLWFVMRPAFNLFLTYNPGYGFTFGSFKSIFIVIIWIYYSQVVFLFGAEITAALNRRESVLIRRLMEGRKAVPESGRTRFQVHYDQGALIFREGDEGNEMYYVLSGSISIRKDGREIAVVGKGKYFGEMSFLLSMKRTASAAAADNTELIMINRRNIDTLMKEFPEYIREMLTEMAHRLRETNERLR